ncbi:MAG: acyltransferase 3, partial [Rhodoferax sp.]|nr:acyltransferase 3 [Rhodoferax sp.]
TKRFDATQPRLPQITDFLLRRVIRVVPLYWLALLYQNKRQLVEGTINPQVAYDFLFIPRYSEWHPGLIWPSLVPGWTINYEMLFYSIFSAALIFGRRRHMVLVLAIFILSFVGYVSEFTSPALKFWTSSIILEFVMGIGVYWVTSRREYIPSRFLVIFAIIAGIFGLYFEELHGLPRALIHGPFAAMIVWSAIYIGRWMPHQPWLHKIGDASYSIYLVHQFTFVISWKICTRLNLSDAVAFNIISALAIQTITATAIGLVVHQLIEKPLLAKLQHWWANAGRHRFARIKPA